VAYANLRPIVELERLPKMVLEFAGLSEKEKQDVFQSIKLGREKELAKIELYQDEAGSPKQELIAECRKRAQTYSVLMKKVLPQHFRDEYLSLQELQDKKQNVEATFAEA